MGQHKFGELGAGDRNRHSQSVWGMSSSGSLSRELLKATCAWGPLWSSVQTFLPPTQVGSASGCVCVVT